MRAANNRENNREFFELASRNREFCPKAANFVREQGINREFCGYLAKLLFTKWLVPTLLGFKKLTGN
jgi:hypothetical protein